MKTLKIFLFFLFFWLQYSLWIGKNGVLDYIKIYQKVKIQIKENEKIEALNNQIRSEILKLNKEILNSSKKYNFN